MPWGRSPWSTTCARPQAAHDRSGTWASGATSTTASRGEWQRRQMVKVTSAVRRAGRRISRTDHLRDTQATTWTYDTAANGKGKVAPVQGLNGFHRVPSLRQPLASLPCHHHDDLPAPETSSARPASTIPDRVESHPSSGFVQENSTTNVSNWPRCAAPTGQARRGLRRRAPCRHRIDETSAICPSACRQQSEGPDQLFRNRGQGPKLTSRCWETGDAGQHVGGRSEQGYQ